LAIGAPALIASSCLIAAARYRRVSANKSIGSIACPPVFAISISAEAFEAIAATLADGYEAEARPDGKGGYLARSVRLDR
jgi:hypothetical protein